MEQAPFISKQVISGQYYYLNLKPAPDAPGTVVCGGLEHCAPDYRIARRRFEYHSIEYVAAGEGSLTVRGRSFPLRPGAMFYYGPTTRHEIASDPECPLLKYFVDFCGNRFTGLLRRHPLGGHEPRYPICSSKVRDLFDDLLHVGRQAGPKTKSVCACLLEMLILQASESAPTPDDAQSGAVQTYQKCRDFIEHRYRDMHTLADIAQACNITVPYLCRLFRRFGMESVYDLLIRLKMRHAADLLNGQTPLVKQAARAVGYEDPYHFSRVFKKIYGVAPTTFLKASHRRVDDPLT